MLNRTLNYGIVDEAGNLEKSKVNEDKGKIMVPYEKLKVKE